MTAAQQPFGGEYLSRQQQRYLERAGRKAARRVSHVHKLIAAVAREAAAELYEKRMRHNAIYDSWKAMHPDLVRGSVIDAAALRERFIAKYWGACIPFARTTLAQLLTRPTIDTTLKEEIMEALILDSTLRKGRADPQRVMGEIT
jgi:hypothetical protein